jgi:hypothetical protein
MQISVQPFMYKRLSNFCHDGFRQIWKASGKK